MGNCKCVVGQLKCSDCGKAYRQVPVYCDGGGREAALCAGYRHVSIPGERCAECLVFQNYSARRPALKARVTFAARSSVSSLKRHLHQADHHLPEPRGLKRLVHRSDSRASVDSSAASVQRHVGEELLSIAYVDTRSAGPVTLDWQIPEASSTPKKPWFASMRRHRAGGHGRRPTHREGGLSRPQSHIGGELLAPLFEERRRSSQSDSSSGDTTWFQHPTHARPERPSEEQPPPIPERSALRLLKANRRAESRRGASPPTPPATAASDLESSVWSRDSQDSASRLSGRCSAWSQESPPWAPEPTWTESQRRIEQLNRSMSSRPPPPFTHATRQ